MKPTPKEAWNSECPRDYKKHHCFERVGVVLAQQEFIFQPEVFLIYRCSQCKQGIWEVIDEVDSPLDNLKLEKEAKT